MKAIICAAGEGKRLRPYTNDRPKCLVEINGKSILKYSLDNLSDLEITEVIIVIGYHADRYNDLIGRKYKNCNIAYIVNEDYGKTDNMSSLWLARGHISEGYVYLNGDVITEKQILDNLIKNPNENVCVVDDNLKLTRSSMKLKVVDNKIVGIGRDLRDGNARAIGVYKYSSKGAKEYFKEIGKLIRSNNKMMQIELPLQEFIKKNEVYAERTGNLFWEEIDDKNDLRRAKERLLKNNDNQL